MIGYGIIEWSGIQADRTVSDDKPDFELMSNREINR